jgi:malate dehydrogenase
LDKITAKEQDLVKVAVDGLKGNIAKGVDFVQNPPPAK